jgi:hypothetical protein
MNDYASKFFNGLTTFRSFAGPFFTPALPWLEFSAFILSIILSVFIIYFTVKSNMFVYRVDEFVDALVAGDVLLRRRTARGWKEIMRKARSQDPANWSAAIITADKILGDLLRLAGYRGGSIDDRLSVASADQITNLEEIKSAHALREKLIKDPSYALRREEMLEALRMYRATFKEFDLID